MIAKHWHIAFGDARLGADVYDRWHLEAFRVSRASCAELRVLHALVCCECGDKDGSLHFLEIWRLAGSENTKKNASIEDPQLISARSYRPPANVCKVLAEECARVRRVARVEVQFNAAPHEATRHADHQLVLFRLFQEALNNALKHSQADRITVELGNANGAQITVADNGRGFLPPPDGGTQGTGQGLWNMQRRATLIGYSCIVASRPGLGTRVIFKPQ